MHIFLCLEHFPNQILTFFFDELFMLNLLIDIILIKRDILVPIRPSTLFKSRIGTDEK